MKGQKGIRAGLATWAAFALLAGPALCQSAKPVALVNGEAIMPAEVEAIMSMQPPTTTPLTAAQQNAARRDVLEMLINEMVMKQFFQRELRGQAALKPGSPEVNKQIAELAEGLKKKGGTVEKFLKEGGMTEAQLRANVIKHLQWETYVSDHLSLDTMKRYYEAYKPFFEKVVVRAAHILIRVAGDAKDIDKQVARNKLRAIREEILAGKISFADAAKRYSEDDVTRAEGGDIGFFPRKFVALEPFAHAAFAMKKGEISDVVETEVGMHLIMVIDRSAGETSTFEKVKDDVRRVCMMEMANAIMARERKAARVVNNLPK